MPNSTRRSTFGTTSKGQAVTVIEAPVARSQRRKAKVAFWVTGIGVAVLAGTVASDYLHPILGGLLGLALGALLGALVAALILIWPVLRMIWHWLPEILLGSFLVYGWTWLMFATPLWLSLLILAVFVGAPAAYGKARQAVMSVYWCLTVRHRLRMCFAAFIATNRQGTLPFILIARPTPAGERVWVWLRPGLSIHDLEQPGQVQKLAVACWAKQVRITPAASRYAALIRIDITRREPLAATVLSPLPDHVPDDVAYPAPVFPAREPVGVNLADVPTPRRKRAADDNSDTRSRRSGNPETPSSDSLDPSDYA